MSRREEPIASSSSTTLESPTTSSLSTTDTTTEQAVPTLSSLLLSTAESLVSRSKSLPTTTGFTLSSSPSTLLSNPSTAPYLSSLLSHSLPSLSSLPKSLASLSSTLDSDLSTLAFTRYPSFLLSHEASQQISTSFTSLSDSLTSLLDSTSELDTASHSFEGKVNEIRKKRDRIRLVRERIEAVEELLEAPQVVESCVRAGQWNEAIQVSRRISQSLKRYQARDQAGGALGILERVQEGVDRALLGLRGKVLETLGERTLKLPGAVRGVGILRKISTERGEVESGKGKRKEGAVVRELDEDGLRIVFLGARWKCLKSELEGVEAQMSACGIDTTGGGATVKGKVSVEENDERTRWIKRWIEVWREIVGETIGMYSEVFLTREKDKEQEAELDEFLVPHPTLPPIAPLELFLSTSLTSLHSILRSSLSFLTSTASLSTLLTQLTYCSHSFTRHGLSFHSHLQLSQLFENRVSQIMLAEWEQAGKRWEAEWREGWSLSGGSALVTTSIKARRNGRTPIKDWLVVPEGVNTLLSTPLPPAPTSFTSPNIDSPPWHHQPSTTLALLPPLAHLLNTYVNSLNSLRLLPPSSIFPILLHAQSKELERASRVLEAFIDAWSSSFAQSTPIPPKSFDSNEAELSEEESTVVREREEEKRVVLNSMAWFGRELIPWVRGALVEGVYRELHQQKEKDGKRAEEAGLRDARKRVEKLIARIEGREFVDPDAPRPLEEARSNGKMNGNGEVEEPKEEEGEPIEEGGGALPVLEIPTGPLESLSSPAKASNGTGANLERDAPLEFTRSPIEPSSTDEPSLDLPPNGQAENENGEADEEGEESKPYLVDEIAPPPPLPAQENGVNGIERDVDGSLGRGEAVETEV